MQSFPCFYKNIFTIFLFFLLSFASSFSYGQVYETEELRLQAESEIQEKNARLGITQTDEEIVIKEEATQVLPDFKGYFTISKIEAVNIAKNYTEEDSRKFNQEAQREFEQNDFRISLEENKFYIIDRSKNTFSKAFEIKQVEQTIQIVCETCSFPIINIISKSEDELVLDFPNQDEGKNFEFRFTFKKNHL